MYVTLEQNLGVLSTNLKFMNGNTCLKGEGSWKIIRRTQIDFCMLSKEAEVFFFYSK